MWLLVCIAFQFIFCANVLWSFAAVAKEMSESWVGPASWCNCCSCTRHSRSLSTAHQLCPSQVYIPGFLFCFQFCFNVALWFCWSGIILPGSQLNERMLYSLVTHADCVDQRGWDFWVGLFICICISLQHNSKTNDRSQSVQTWYRESSWDTLEVVLFWGSKVKDQGHRVNKCIFHTNVWSITQKRMIPKCSNLV